MDKNNLTNFQRIFRNENDIPSYATQITMDNSPPIGQATSSAIFHAIHSVNSTNQIDQDTQQGARPQGEQSRKKYGASTAAVICNPLILGQPGDDPQNQGASNNDIRKNSNSLNGGTSGSTMHINQIFGDTNEHVTILGFLPRA
jgi:hypothetical protein